MKLTRREMLKFSLLGSAALALPLAASTARIGGPEPLRQLPKPFQAHLPLPAVLKPDPARSTPTTDFYEVTARKAEAIIPPGKKTPVWTINDETWDEGCVYAAPHEGDTEIWEFENNGGGWIHPIHLHLTNFKILSRNGKPPNADETGWKDTVFLGSNDTARVLLKWPEVPIGPDPGDFVRRYPFHCHVTEHEDHDMMLQYEVREKA